MTRNISISGLAKSYLPESSRRNATRLWKNQSLSLRRASVGAIHLHRNCTPRRRLHSGIDFKWTACSVSLLSRLLLDRSYSKSRKRHRRNFFHGFRESPESDSTKNVTAFRRLAWIFFKKVEITTVHVIRLYRKDIYSIIYILNANCLH